MLKTYKYQLAALCAVVTAIALPTTSLFAADDSKETKKTAKESKAAKAVVEEAKKSFITGDLGVTWTTAYVSRGLVLQGHGVIIQPYADLYFKLYEGEGFVNSVTLNLGIWSSIHDQHPGATGGTKGWYEFDYTPGVAVTFAKNFTLTTSYFEFDSPNGSFASAHSINVNLAYNDSDLLGAFALHPHATVLFELGGPGSAGLQTGGEYYEVGIAPSVPLNDPKSNYPLSLTFPITAGFGSSGFYAGDAFGYVSAGATASVGLGFIPSGYGAWTLSASGLYYHLGTAVANATNKGEQDFGVAQASLGLTF